MGETIEKVLKPYKGFNITKIIDNKGTSKEVTTYMATNSNDDLLDCKPTLAKIKKCIDIYTKND